MKKSEDANSYKPNWTPKDAGNEFAVNIIKGVAQKKSLSPSTSKKRGNLSINDYVNGVINGDRTLLARAITLIESNSHSHLEKAKEVLQKLMPYSGKSIRIGITGVPGAGKSTFIETLGLYLINQGHKVAVLAVDPSSTVTKGSILGDKTRMEKLSREGSSFIRPSPSSGTLGGVTRKSKETIILCEAAGFDIILIETVGVGQSEITVRSMVDFFLLILISGAGDELQGIKKGVIELADAILINKADGDNYQKAVMAKADYSNALKYIHPATKGWQTQAFTCSALTGDGITEIWNVIRKFHLVTQNSGAFDERRKVQLMSWFDSLVEEGLRSLISDHSDIQKIYIEHRKNVLEGNILAPQAADIILESFKNSLSHKQ
jgi:LAO/AO transport system kinase